MSADEKVTPSKLETMRHRSTLRKLIGPEEVITASVARQKTILAGDVQKKPCTDLFHAKPSKRRAREITSGLMRTLKGSP